MFKLQTDYNDYYDYQFANGDKIWQRCMTDGPDRIGILNTLKYLDLTVPRYGTDTYHYQDAVVHKNINSHCGEDKVYVFLNRATIIEPTDFLVEFIKPDEKATSYRYLSLGKYGWWLKYSSDDEWRSNVGNVKIDHIPCPIPYGTTEYGNMINAFSKLDKILPIFAIDFVLSSGKLYAVDLNMSPGSRFTNVDRSAHPKKLADGIKERLPDLPDINQPRKDLIKYL